MNNNEIFKYIKPYDNNMLSKMKGFDLQDLIYYINHYYLELRNNLEIKELKEKVGFGIELECEHANVGNIRNHLYDLNPNWKIRNDASLDFGTEVISPILHDNKNSWKELEQVCNTVDKDATIGKNSGGHLHIGAQILNDNVYTLLNLMDLWMTYENIIYRFSYGEYLNPRKSITYASPISDNYYKTNIQKFINKSSLSDDDVFYIIDLLKSDRYVGINFQNMVDTECQFLNNTIEFRCPNGSTNPVIWQNNINLFTNLLLYSQSNDFNNEIINNRKKQNGNKYDKLELYNEIYLPQSLEFCDMIFNKNIDKVYFLRQYLKSFEIDKTKKMHKAKEFTKTKKGPQF